MEIEKMNREKRPEIKERKVHLSLFQKKPILWIEQPEQVKQQVTPPIKFNANMPQWSGSNSSEGEDIRMRKCRRESYVTIIN